MFMGSFVVVIAYAADPISRECAFQPAEYLLCLPNNFVKMYILSTRLANHL